MLVCVGVLCVLSVKHVVLFGEVWLEVITVLQIREFAFGSQHKKCFSFPHTHMHAHIQSLLSHFVFLGSTHLQPYYPESSAAAQPALCCWSVLLVTSAPSARSTQLRSSGISPMENLLRIQKKAVHTSNCDGVFHPGSTAPFLRLVPGWNAVSSHQRN